MLPKFLKPYHVKLSNLIRIGPKTDGGYVIDKRVLNKTKILITCGLNDDWEFEKSFLEQKPAIKIITFDHTVNQDFWVKRFKKDIIHFLLLKKLRISKILDIFKFINYYLFFRENRKHYIKKVVFKKKNNEEITIPKILKNYDKVFLKVDIEGSEYVILEDILKVQNKISALIIEFHDIDKNRAIIENFIQRLELSLTHIHPNNYGKLDENNDPIIIELSFEKYPKIIDGEVELPNILDQKNNPKKNDIFIKFNEN